MPSVKVFMQSFSKLAFLSIVAVVFSFLSCVTYSDQEQKFRIAYVRQDFAESLKLIEASKLRSQNRNQLLYLMEKAMILDRLQQSKKSRQSLLAASKVASELFTVSLSKTAATFIYNDSASDYSGEDYEKVAIHALLALSFLEDGKNSSALVEARKINSVLREINDQYKEKKNRYSEDAFARYLAGNIYEAKGEIDSAIIGYSRALTAYEKIYAKRFATQPPRSLIKSLHRLLVMRRRSTKIRPLVKKYPWLSSEKKRSKQAFAVVIHELGTVAVKREKTKVIPVGKQFVRLSFPHIFPRNPQRFKRTGVGIKKQFFSGELVQNQDGIASHTLEDRRLRMVLKQGVRLLIKGQLARKAKKEMGSLAGLAVNLIGAVTETADTRGWMTLPSAFYMTKIPVKVGESQLKIFSDGKLVQAKSINPKSGEIIFIRAKS